MAPKKQYDITPDELRNMHHDQLMSPLEIAGVFGCSRDLIYHYLRKFGIEKRPKNQNLLGKRFGRLTVIKFLGISESRQAEWLCRCDCGSMTVAPTGQLNFGLQSCGCLNIEKTTTHGMSNTRPYRIWQGMKSRCDNPKAYNYADYGGRGIKHCKSWTSFENFWHDMQKGYSPDKTLDRIDNDGGYCPENCRWATTGEQSQHKTNSALLTYNDQTLNVTQWAEKLGVSRKILYARKRAGWPDDKVLETPYRPRK